MPASWLDIADTAIKIGLGALISGIATYSVTRLNHAHEVSKDYRAQARQLLEQVATQAEEASHCAMRYWSQITDWTRKRDNGVSIPEDYTASVKQTRKELYEAFRGLSSAEAQLLLLGETKAQELLRALGEQIGELYSRTHVGPHETPLAEVENWRLLILEERERFFNEISAAYKRINR